MNPEVFDHALRDSNASVYHASKAPIVSKTLLYAVAKRALDVIGSLAGLILALPLLFIFSILIKVESPGPIFYSQIRVGKNGKEFSIYKLRSMKIDAEINGPQMAKKNDPRITKIGCFIRKVRIDEIPQLINVLYGHMSLVGPRPERPEFTIQINEKVPRFIQRLQVKPGVTGLAQISGAYNIPPEEKLKYDLEYIHKSSLWFDLMILLRTVGVVLSGFGAR